MPVVTASCFLQNPPLGTTGRFGTAGRNSFSGPGLGNLDLSIFRKFDLTERAKLEFRAEATNATNSPAFANPNLTLGDSNFGRLTGTLAVEHNWALAAGFYDVATDSTAHDLVALAGIGRDVLPPVRRPESIRMPGTRPCRRAPRWRRGLPAESAQTAPNNL